MPMAIKYLEQLVALSNTTYSQMVMAHADHAQMNVYFVSTPLRSTVDPAILGMSCPLLYLVACPHKESTLMERETVMHVKI